MKKQLVVIGALLIVLMWALPAFAQTLEYGFSGTTGTYTPITGGLSLGTETTDDQRFVDPAAPAGATTTTGPGLPIGFNFTFNNAVFDRLAINANGWISLGQSALTPSVNNSSTSGYTPISSTVAITPDVLYNRIAGLARDLQAQVGASLRLETIGTAPNRVCVVQWHRYKKYGTSGPGDSLYFQIRLNETTNNVQIVYGNIVSNATAGNFQVGLRGPLATDFNSRTTATDWTNTTASVTNADYCVMSSAILPPPGYTFNFNYPIANQPPNPANVTSPANNAIQISPFTSLNWVSGGGLPTGYKISFGTNNPPTNITNNQDLGNLNTFDPPGDLIFNTTYYWKVVPYNAFGDATNCPVWQFTTHGDGNIYTLPYVQNFDAVTVPALPFDWTGLVQSSVTTAYVRTVTTTPNSAPNCVALFNSTDITGHILLIAPALNQTIATNTTRLRFKAKPGGANYTLSVGVISNPTDPTTYQEIQLITLPTTTWTEYVVTMASYTGTGRMLAFKHPHGASSRSIYIDDAEIELIAQNDLACTALTGNTTPSVNANATFNARIFNWGSVSQSTYTVKLFTAAGVELATAAGLTCAPGVEVTVPLVWTPTEEGTFSIYAKVFLTGDQNPTNDQSPNLNVLVVGAGTNMVTIGDGTTVNGTSGVPTPYGTFYKNFHQQYLYTAAEIIANGGGTGMLTAIAFNVDVLNTCSPMPNYTIKIKHTQQSALTTTFEVGDYQTVWVQNDFLPTTGWNTHPFTTPFIWDGVSNVLVDIITTMIPGAYTQNASVFYTATTGVNTTLRYQSDTVDAATSATGTTSVNRANIRLTLNMSGTGSLGGTVSSAGSPLGGVYIAINNTVYNTTTATNGTYNFPFLQPGNYTVTASKLGYETQSSPAVIVADQATSLNFSMPASQTVNVTGTVVGSDAPTVGLNNATITLSGVLDYTGTTNASGQFTITGVLSGNTYNYTIVRAGYQNLTGSIVVSAANYNMGTLTMNELTLPPVQVQAELNTAQSSVTVTWRPPGSTGGFYFSDFDSDNGGWVPSSSWTNPLGDWEWTDTYNSANFVATESPTSCFPPTVAHSGTGLWATKLYTNYTNSGGFNYLTQTFDLSGLDNPVLRFWNWNNSFGNFDYGQVAVNGTVIWGPNWHTAPYSWQEVIIPLNAYGGMSNVVVQFQHYATTVVAYAGWYLDDVYIGAPETLAMLRTRSPKPQFSPLPQYREDAATRLAHAELERAAAGRAVQTTYNRAPISTPARVINDRIPVGYKVWRLLQGNEQNEASWTLLTANTITDTIYVNTGWQSLADGHYKWAVKTVYTNNVLSTPAFSNMIRKRPNDLSALLLTGTTTPTSGVQTTYNVTVKNTGTAAQNAGAYTVKLMSGTTELASVTGPAIAVNEEVLVPINWTPTTPGPMALFGKTVHPGDTAPDNDNSPILNITVMPEGVVAVTVGEGNQLDGKPFEFLNNNSLYQCLYYPSEIGRFGNITALSFYNSFTTNFVNKPIKIWLGTTQLADLSGGWILPANNLTLVYDGTANFPSGLNTITIPLQTAFQYTSGNLVLYANRPMDTVIGVAADDFKVQTIGTNRARKVSSNTVTYDPAAPSAVGTLSGQFPMTTFHMTAIGTTPLYTVNPTVRAFGTVLINSTHNQVFTVSNAGGAPLVVSAVTIAGSPFFTLQNVGTLPATIAFGETLTFTGRYLPTAEGTHAATISVTDNMARQVHTIELSGTCIDTQINALPYAQNFDTVTTPALPVDWNKIVQATVTTAYVQTYTTTPNSAPNCAGMTNSSDANATLLLIAPPYAPTIATNTTRVKFFARGGATAYTLSVGVMTDYTNAATYQEVQSIQLTNVWAEYVVTFAGYTGTGRTIAFKHGLGGTSRLIYIDTVMLEVIPQNDLAALNLVGNSTPTAGAPSNYTVNVFNWGSNPQTTYQVKLFKQGDIEIGSVAGPTINPGQTQAVVVPWTPDQQGATFIYGKVVLTGDQNNLNDQTANFNVFVQPPGIFTFTIGDGSQTARIPIDMYYRNSLHQYMIYPAEIGNTIGMITAIGLYNQFTQDLLNMPTKIWIGTTTEANLSAGWIPVTNHTLVFDGTMNYPIGENTLTFPFLQPFLYLNGENLVFTFQRPMDTQYYQTTNYFKAQTGTPLRARHIFSDTVTYDPLVPPATGGTNTGQFAKTTLFMIPGGVGHLNGTVLGVGNQALGGVSVTLSPGGYSATTIADGTYSIINILPNTYQASFSRHGYITQTQTIVIEEDETEVLNVTMQQMPTVSVSGTITASDTGAGISGAGITLQGYENYTAATNTQGQFTIAGVYATNTYNYTIIAPGYQNASGVITVGTTNHSMGTIVINEVAYAPRQVSGEIVNNNSQVNLEWLAPDPTALDLTEGFESATFPPENWTNTVTNTEPANTMGVFPTWCRFGSVTISGTPVDPSEGNWQSGLWWSYEHQDEWLITPQFNCPPSAYLTFDSHVFLGSTNGDHYYIKVTTDGGTNWTVLWDASAQTGGWNSYASPITIDLSTYEGLQIKLAWHAEDPPSNDGLWYVWFIDNIYIGNQITSLNFSMGDMSVRSAAPTRNSMNESKASPTGWSSSANLSMSRAGEITPPRTYTTDQNLRSTASTRNYDRSLIGYRVWRLASGQESNENSWTSITAANITQTELLDSGWATVPNGNYRWAVKAVYTSNVYSVPSFSNVLTKQVVNGTIAGVVRTLQSQPISGATVSAGSYSATTNAVGAYSILLPIGTYDVTATHANYASSTVEDILVSANQTSTVNFNLGPVSNEDDILPVLATELGANYPNPFNPETTISYAIKDPAAVRLEIYNIKGQLIRTLVNQNQATGRYRITWNGKDNMQNSVASGIYFYRLNAGNYSSTKKMLLVE